MQFRDIFTITRGTKVVLKITFLVSAAAILFAFFYYRSINLSEDPRIDGARKILAEYDRESLDHDIVSKFILLNSADSVFRSFPDYYGSFERGVILNNRASALLVAALYDTAVKHEEENTLLELAMIYCDSSITVYRNWIKDWSEIDRIGIESRLRKSMNAGHPAFKGRNFEKIIARRVSNQITAQTETPRRLSVSLSNKGIIFRHLMMPDSALDCFKKSLELWKDNRSAKSNLSVLLGGKPLEPGMIESLFPPDRNKK
jgi:tetratricopeptide (TPR) repeat protein